MSGFEAVELPSLKLFLSVDIVGSTKLKDQVNHSKLLSTYEDRLQGIAGLKKHIPELANMKGDWDAELIQAILSDKSRENADWATILENQFKEFHSAFIDDYSKKYATPVDQLISITDNCIWKCLGDEVIYYFDITDIKQIHFLCYAFLTTLRRFDKSAREKQSSPTGGKVMRMKGVGWLAGFPIRNRGVEFPGQGGKKDFLGPDVDIGFRLGKHSYPGFMVVSLDLAYMLGDVQTNSQLLGHIVGWSRLQGVWDENPYPIIWIAPPDYNKKIDYEDLKTWAAFDNPYAKEWKKIKDGGARTFKEMKDLHDEIGKIREELPPSLGLIPPYIYNGTAADMHDSHQKIHKILSALSPGAGGLQDEKDPEAQEAGAGTDESKLIEKMTKKVEELTTNPPSSDTPGYPA